MLDRVQLDGLGVAVKRVETLERMSVWVAPVDPRASWCLLGFCVIGGMATFGVAHLVPFLMLDCTGMVVLTPVALLSWWVWRRCVAEAERVFFFEVDGVGLRYRRGLGMRAVSWERVEGLAITSGALVLVIDGQVEEHRWEHALSVEVARSLHDRATDARLAYLQGQLEPAWQKSSAGCRSHLRVPVGRLRSHAAAVTGLEPKEIR